MLIAGTDLETTGLIINELHVTELSAILWDTERSAPARIFTSLVQLPDGVEIPEVIVKLNGIRRVDCQKWGKPLDLVLNQAYLEVFQHADAAAAHNWTDFEGPIFKHLDADVPSLAIDTSVDVPYPDSISTRKLEFLCASHRFLNYFPHRAAFDTIAMLQVLAHYPIEQVLELAKSPTLRIRADVPFQDREKAKARGYRWDLEQKIWAKNLKECHLVREREEAGFPVLVLE